MIESSDEENDTSLRGPVRPSRGARREGRERLSASASSSSGEDRERYRGRGRPGEKFRDCSGSEKSGRK